MKEFYDMYWTKDHPPPTLDPLTPRRLEILWRLTRESRASPKNLLDCGSGEGHLVAAAIDKGIECEGMEISEAALEGARRIYPNLRFWHHSVEDRPWPVSIGSFDIITSFEVIEHLLRPREFLRGAYEVLRPGGYLALTTPYHGLSKNLALALLAFDSHFDVDGGHIRFFSDKSVRRLLNEEGFEILEQFHFGRCWPLWAEVFVWAKKV